MITIDITETNVMDAVGRFLSSVFDCRIQKGQENYVPRPQGDCIIFNAVGRKVLSRNHHSCSIDEWGIMTPTEFTVQIDFYGEGASDKMETFMSIIHDGFAFESFPPDIKPLYASDPQQVPLITGEKNYLQRWSTDLSLQYNPTVKIPIDTFDDVSVTIIRANGL